MGNFFTKNEWKEFIFWTGLAIAFVLLCLLSRTGKGSELDDYLIKNKLKMPVALEERIRKADLVPAFGMECEENHHRYFTVFYVHKSQLPSEEDIKEINMIDPSLIILKVRYNVVKKSVIVDFCTYDHKLWSAIEVGQKRCRIELFDL